MNDDEKLKLMKTRIIRSFGWQKDIIIPLSKDFDCSPEELEDVFFDLLDMSSLEAMHGTFETAEYLCLIKRLHADLRLCWFNGTLELISNNQCDLLKENLAKRVMAGEKYSDVLKDGHRELFALLKKLK